MSFKGTFELVSSTRLGGTKTYSFVLKCTNLVFGETIDCMICDEFGQRPFYFRDQKLKAGRSYRFDYDTVDWTWCQHDYFAIITKDNKIVKKWPLDLKEYGPGECPDCHGTHKCKYCHGKGYIYPPGHVEDFVKCDHCGGSGICFKCDIPLRSKRRGGPPTGIGNGFK